MLLVIIYDLCFGGGFPLQLCVAGEHGVWLVIRIILQLEVAAAASLHLLVRPLQTHLPLQLPGRVKGGLRPVTI